MKSSTPASFLPRDSRRTFLKASSAIAIAGTLPIARSAHAAGSAPRATPATTAHAWARSPALAMGTPRRCTATISARPCSSGSGITICTWGRV